MCTAARATGPAAHARSAARGVSPDRHHLYGSELPVVVVSDLYMPTDGRYLRVSTYGRGVWETRF